MKPAYGYGTRRLANGKMRVYRFGNREEEDRWWKHRLQGTYCAHFCPANKSWVRRARYRISRGLVDSWPVDVE